eukprot:10901034-Ditylum_brightwellii.AAC.1
METTTNRFRGSKSNCGSNTGMSHVGDDENDASVAASEDVHSVTVISYMYGLRSLGGVMLAV